MFFQDTVVSGALILPDLPLYRALVADTACGAVAYYSCELDALHLRRNRHLQILSDI